jgi:hypothetical protein
LFESNRHKHFITKYVEFGNYLSVIAALVGVVAIFWHFSTLIGLACLAASALSIIFCFLFMRDLEEANKESSAPEENSGETAPDRNTVEGSPE